MSRIDDAFQNKMKFELTLFQNVIADLKDYPKFAHRFIDVAYNSRINHFVKKTKRDLPLNKKKKITGRHK
jgi:hypothetical protein